MEEKQYKELNSQFFIILDNYVNEYKISKSHPDISSYSDILAATESRYKDLKKRIFLYKNSLERKNEELTEKIRKQTKDIETFRTRINRLKSQSNNLHTIENSALGLYEEEINLYSNVYYEIIAIIIGIILASGYTYASFRKK